jgi:hypothetical protein
VFPFLDPASSVAVSIHVQLVQLYVNHPKPGEKHSVHSSIHKTHRTKRRMHPVHPLPVRLGNTLQLILLLDGVGVAAALGGVDKLLS